MTPKRFVLSLLVILFLAIGASAAEVEPAHSTSAVRLLTVGNSFTNNATRYLADLAKAGGQKLVHRSLIIGGSPLQLHAEKMQKHGKDVTDKAGLYANGLSLRKALESEPWDIVTLQQLSMKSHNVDTYRPYAGQLAECVRKYAPTAKLLLHETWAYRRDDPRFAVKSPKPGEPATQEEMYQGLRNAYRTIATELGAGLIPVGDAFHRADTDSRWGYEPDMQFPFQNAEPPELPDQTHSLHVGWRWRKQQDGSWKLGMDGHHANTAGEYLGACVFYEVLFGDSVVGNPFAPPKLDPTYARFLQETAHQSGVELKNL